MKAFIGRDFGALEVISNFLKSLGLSFDFPGFSSKDGFLILKIRWRSEGLIEN